MHGEEAERSIEVHAGVGDVEARVGWCATGYCVEGGDGGGFEAEWGARRVTRWATSGPLPPAVGSAAELRLCSED